MHVCIIIQLKYGYEPMRAVGSFHCPETRFISRGSAEENIPGQGGMDTSNLVKTLSIGRKQSA